MIKYTLNNKLHWSATKHHELAGAFPVSPQSATEIAKGLKVNTHNATQEKLNFRAKYLDDDQHLIQALARLRAFVLLGAVALILCAGVLGFISTSLTLNAQSHEHTINFYTVLVGLLGASTLALLFWLLMLFMKTLFSPMQLGLKWFINRFAARSDEHTPHASPPPYTASAAKAWGEFLFASSAGRWCLSVLLHMGWVTFLLGSLLCILYKLSIEHYQFVWESTLLSSDTFVWLTQSLSKLPSALGFTTPSIEHIQQSQLQSALMGGVSAASPEASQAWAMLLMGSLFIYGIAPRLLLVLLCAVWACVLSKRWLPNFDEPYYQKLMLALTLSSLDATVLDEDTSPPNLPPHSGTRSEALLNAHPKQALTQWLEGAHPWQCATLEVHPTPTHWTPSTWAGCVDVGALNDRNSIQHALATLNPAHNTLVLCELDAVPDRGVQRVLAQFAQNSQTLTLALLADNAFNTARLEQWLALATKINAAHTLVINDVMDIIQS